MKFAYSPAQWSNFFLAIAGAAAALTGLIFVAVSMHLRYVVKDYALRTGAGITLFGMILAFVVSMEGMIPGQSRVALGLEVLATLCIWYAMWVMSAIKARRTLGKLPDLARRRLPFSYLCSMLMYLGSIGLLTRSMGGLVVLAPGLILCMLIAVQNAWFFLTEIGLDEEQEEENEEREISGMREAIEGRELTNKLDS